MRVLVEYLRERLPIARFGPAALFVGLLGGPACVDRIVEVVLAWLLIASFRVRDDLADRPHDADAHPERVLVRAASTRPFVVAMLIALGLAIVGLGLTHGLVCALDAIVIALAFELGYRLELRGREHWVLLKYPLFAALLGSPTLTLAGLCYLSFAVYDSIDDRSLRVRVGARPRLTADLLLAAVLAWTQLERGAASLGWFAAVGGLWGLSVEAVRARRAGARLSVFLLTALVWAQANLQHAFTQHGALAQALWLALPVTFAGLTHVLVIRRGWLASLAAVRLDLGLELRGRPLFGANKTLRGLVVMVGACVVWTAAFDGLQRVLGLDDSLRFVAREQLGSLGLGLVLGLAYVVGELPNSMIKRQLDIEPGDAGRGWARPVTWVIDQLDSPLAILAALSLVRPPSPGFVVALLGLSLIIHPGVAALMVALGLKRRVG